MKLVTGVFRINDHRCAVTRNADPQFDPKGVVGHVVLRNGKWYIEGDESQTPYEHENLAAGALVRSLQGDCLVLVAEVGLEPTRPLRVSEF